MGDVSAEVFAANDVPARPELPLDLSLDDPCHFAVLLGLEGALQIRDLFDGRVADADDDALLLRRHVGVPDEDLLGGSLFLLLVVQLVLLLDLGHLFCIT